jgi:hypothetical protein
MKFLRRFFSKRQRPVDPAESINGFEFIDEYLRKWDAFAREQDQCVPYLNANLRRFCTELAEAFYRGDPRAPSRFVFFAVVRVAVLIPADQEPGKAFTAKFPSAIGVTNDDAESGYFPGDVYFWWEENKERFAAFSLYDAWARSSFARKSVIPAYKNIKNNPEMA